MTAFDDFPELAGKERQAERAAQLLERAAQTVTALAPGETWLGAAERLRGAASYAQTATAEILMAVGWFEAADAASRAGLLDIIEAPTDTDPQAMNIKDWDTDDK